MLPSRPSSLGDSDCCLPQFPLTRVGGLAGEFEPLGREGVAGNGALLAPATSNPRLACEDNGCLIFSIRRAQCRILSFTRGGASEVISQCHSARTLLLCGGREDGGGRRGRPRWPGLAAGRGVQLRPLQRGPADPTGCGNPAWLLRERPCLRLHRAPRSRLLRSGCGDPGLRLCGGAAAAGVAPHHTPTFIRTSSAFLPLSLGSQRAKRGRKERGERGGWGA